MTNETQPQNEESRSSEALSGLRFKELRLLYERGPDVVNAVSCCISGALTLDEFWKGFVEGICHAAQVMQPDAWLLLKHVSSPTEQNEILRASGLKSEGIGIPSMLSLATRGQTGEDTLIDVVDLGAVGASRDVYDWLSSSLPFQPGRAFVANFPLDDQTSAILFLISRSRGSSVWLDETALERIASVWHPLLKNCYIHCRNHEVDQKSRAASLDALTELAGLFAGVANIDEMANRALKWVLDRLHAEVAAILLETRMDIREFFRRVAPRVSEELILRNLVDGPRPIRVLRSIGHRIAGVESSDTPNEIYVISEEDLAIVSQLTSEGLEGILDRDEVHATLRDSPLFATGWTGAFYVSPDTSAFEQDFHGAKSVLRYYERMFTREMRSHRLCHCAATKLIAGKGKIGVLRVTNKIHEWDSEGRPILDRDGFSREDILLLENLAAGLSLAMSHARLSVEYGDLSHLTYGLFDKMTDSLRADSWKGALRELAEYACLLLPDAESHDVAIYDEEEDRFVNETSADAGIEGTHARWVTTALTESL